MKIAVAADDDMTISRHFGRSASFIVYEIEEGKILGHEARRNTFTAHARGECDDHGHGHHGHQHGHQHGHHEHHGHASILEALRDCQAVICHGMGWRAAQDLEAHGVKPVVLGENLAPRLAVEAYLKGELKPAAGFCRCHE